MQRKPVLFTVTLLAGLVLRSGCPTATSDTTSTATKSENADLSALTISSGTLSPKFAAATTSWRAARRYIGQYPENAVTRFLPFAFEA